MAYLFKIITDASFPSENYYVKGTSIENGFDIKGDLMIKVYDENDKNIAIFRQVRAVTAINEDMLTLNEIREMLSPTNLLMLKPIKDEEIVKVAPVQQEEPKQPKRKMIDRGKVMALHLAGWSGRKIAEEMKCSEQSISNIISQERRKVQNENV